MNREATAKTTAESDAVKGADDGVGRDQLQVGAYATPSSSTSFSRSRTVVLLGVLFAVVAAIVALRLLG